MKKLETNETNLLRACFNFLARRLKSYGVNIKTVTDETIEAMIEAIGEGVETLTLPDWKKATDAYLAKNY